MKKILATILTLFICISMLAGCGTDPVQDDLINYINNQIKPIGELENKVTAEYSAIKLDSNATDESFATKLKDVIIPADSEVIAKAKATVPGTEEVSKVHSKYIAAATTKHEALLLMLDAAQKSDAELMKTANEKLTNSNNTMKEYLADLAALEKEHDVETAK